MEIHVRQLPSICKNLLVALLVCPTLSFAQTYDRAPYSCSIPDSLDIKDDGPDRAIVTYYNSVQSCSQPLKKILISPNGIEVVVVIEIGHAEVNNREIITLFPVSPSMMSFPPEGQVQDGETKQYIITGGIS